MQKKSRVFAVIVIMVVLLFQSAFAQPIAIPNVALSLEPATEPADAVNTIQIILLLTVLALAPSILIMMTSFTRIIIILSFLRNALGTQQMPPNQILIGLALFLTFFIMSPTFGQINERALQPYLANEISQQEAMDQALLPIKEFMLGQIRGDSDLALFVELSGEPAPENLSDLPLTVVIPAFILSELKLAFQIGFIIYIPFLVIDMVVSSTLMSMGMMMLPPVMISLPFKILLFILVDGWRLIVESIVTGFVR